MLFRKKISDAIIQDLAVHKWSSVYELYDRLSHEYTLPMVTVYKTLAQLIQEQVLVKEKWKLSINTNWILAYMRLGATLQQNYGPETANIFSLKQGQEKKFRASTLADLDPIRGNVYAILAMYYGKDVAIYDYNAHLYHMIGMPETEKSVRTEPWFATQTTYFLVGNTTFLDQRSVAYLKNKWFPVCVATNVPFLQEGYVCSVIGDYVLEIVFPAEITQQFKYFFDTVVSEENFDLAAFQRLFHIQQKYVLTLKYAPLYAQRLQSQVLSFFPQTLRNSVNK